MIYRYFSCSPKNSINILCRNLSSNMSFSSSENVREFQIKTPFGFIAAKMWNESGKNIPIFALHGWMDNAGTWDLLCPLLDKNHPIVAIDAAGHGFSSVPLGLGSYITDNLITIERVLQHLQWNKVILLGHSMGGGSSILYSGTMPEKVHKLISIDILKPLHVDPEYQPKRTAKSLTSLLDVEKKLETEPPRYEYQEILERLVKSYGQSLTMDSAKILLKRGAREHEDGKFSFTYSPILKAANTLSMTLEQQEAFASNVVCEFLLIKAVSSPYYADKMVIKQFLEIYKKNSKQFTLEIIEGTHHVHLNDPEPVAKIINAFLQGFPQEEENKKRANEYMLSML